jgi:hypothetical protein
MTKGRRIEPGEKVPVAFTPPERALVMDHTFADPELTEPLEAARLARGKYTVRFSLDDLDALLGHVAAEANHCKSKSLRKELDALFARLQDEMASYDDGQWQESAKVPKPTVRKQRASLAVIKGAKGP